MEKRKGEERRGRAREGERACAASSSLDLPVAANCPGAWREREGGRGRARASARERASEQASRREVERGGIRKREEERREGRKKARDGTTMLCCMRRTKQVDLKIFTSSSCEITSVQYFPGKVEKIY